jgi:hypothetical protein
MGYRDVNWNYLPQDKDEWRTVISAEMSLKVRKEVGNLFAI